MTLVLIRHGESEWNRENLFTGWTDVDLSDAGAEEARNAGLLLRQGGFDFDLCYTSYLKRAIHTLNIVLEQLDREWLPVMKTWKLNERHYGALQGLNKAETALKYGDEQVKIWRRSFDVRPPALQEDDERSPRRSAPYRYENPAELPLCESLKDTIDRVIPFFNKVVLKEMKKEKRVLIVAHGNSIRALVKYLDRLSEAEIMEVNIPTGIPLVYEFDDKGRAQGNHYLGDSALIQSKIDKVADQAKTAPMKL
jgi:phosphoglycerate mutase, BPG-dependent, family 1